MNKLELERELTVIDGIRDAAAGPLAAVAWILFEEPSHQIFVPPSFAVLNHPKHMKLPFLPRFPGRKFVAAERFGGRSHPPKKKTDPLQRKHKFTVAVWLRLALLVAMGNAVQKEMEIALDLDEGDNLYAWAQTTLNFTAPASQRTERRYVPKFGALFRRAVAV